MAAKRLVTTEINHITDNWVSDRNKNSPDSVAFVKCHVLTTSGKCVLMIKGSKDKHNNKLQHFPESTILKSCDSRVLLVEKVDDFIRSY